MSIIILPLLALTVLLAAAYHRWAWRGFAVVATVGVLFALLASRLAWTAPGGSWACMYLGGLPLYVLLILASALALRFAARSGPAWQKYVATGGALGLTLLPTIYVLIWWNVVFLGCDTL